MRFFEQALEAVRRVPGVTAAALTEPVAAERRLGRVRCALRSRLRTQPARSDSVVPLRGEPGLHRDDAHSRCGVAACSTSSDRAGAPRVALISESLASDQVSGSRPDRPAPAHRSARRTAVHRSSAWSGDVKQVSLALSESDAVYITAAQWRFADHVMSLVVRTRGDASGARARHSPGDLVGRQGPADRARRDDGRPARGFGGGAALRADRCSKRSRSRRWSWRPPASTACSPAASPSARARSACASALGASRGTSSRLVLRQGMTPHRARRRDRAGRGGRRQPGDRRDAVRRLAPRPGDLRRRDRAAGGRVARSPCACRPGAPCGSIRRRTLRAE